MSALRSRIWELENRYTGRSRGRDAPGASSEPATTDEEEYRRAGKKFAVMNRCFVEDIRNILKRTLDFDPEHEEAPDFEQQVLYEYIDHLGPKYCDDYEKDLTRKEVRCF
jgi:hypothetical protein